LLWFQFFDHTGWPQIREGSGNGTEDNIIRHGSPHAGCGHGGSVPALVFTQGAFAQQNPVTAIDIALEPDATMVQHAKDANARVCSSLSPKASRWMRRTRQYLPAVCPHGRPRQDICGGERDYGHKPTAWTLKAFKYYYIPDPPYGLAGIVAEPTEDLHRLQDELITAVKPYTVRTGHPGGLLQRGRWTRHSKIAD
jgi:hypothetical protein